MKKYDYFAESLSLLEGPTELEDITISYNRNDHELRILRNDEMIQAFLNIYANI